MSNNLRLRSANKLREMKTIIGGYFAPDFNSTNNTIQKDFLTETKPQDTHMLIEQPLKAFKTSNTAAKLKLKRKFK
jgi:hypothetical protein